MSRCVIPFVAAPGDGDSGDWVAALQRAIPEAQIVAFDAMSTADKAACTVAVVANPRPADLQQLPRLQWVHSVWAGVEPRTQAVARRAMFLWCGRAASHAGPDRYSDLPASTHAPDQGVARCAATKLVAEWCVAYQLRAGAHCQGRRPPRCARPRAPIPCSAGCVRCRTLARRSVAMDAPARHGASSLLGAHRHAERVSDRGRAHSRIFGDRSYPCGC